LPRSHHLSCEFVHRDHESRFVVVAPVDDRDTVKLTGRRSDLQGKRKHKTIDHRIDEDRIAEDLLDRERAQTPSSLTIAPDIVGKCCALRFASGKGRQH
jgi:hypothetical protein